jgi:hypothetical protein
MDRASFMFLLLLTFARRLVASQNWYPAVIVKMFAMLAEPS